MFGEDAHEFNPRRPAPTGGGLQRYGVGFGSGIHQSFGLRVVLGRDGTGGSHVYLLQRLFQLGVRPETEQEPRVQQFGDIPRYITYPVVLAEMS